MLVEFVNAENGEVTDSISLQNSLRRDGHCSFCYSRSNGNIVRTPAMHGAAVDKSILSECGVGHGTGDLDTLAQERLAVEHPVWAAVLDDELPIEWMTAGAEHSSTDSGLRRMQNLFSTILGRVELQGTDAPISDRELVLMQDPDLL